MFKKYFSTFRTTRTLSKALEKKNVKITVFYIDGSTKKGNFDGCEPELRIKERGDGYFCIYIEMISAGIIVSIDNSWTVIKRDEKVILQAPEEPRLRPVDVVTVIIE